MTFTLAHTALLVVGVAILESMRGTNSAQKSAIAYRKKSSKNIHDVQEAEARIQMVILALFIMATQVGHAVALWEIIVAIIAAIIGAYGLLQFGDFAFQIGINEGFTLPRVDRDEDTHWDSPRREGKPMWKPFSGSRRKWQRPFGALLVSIAFCLIVIIHWL